VSPALDGVKVLDLSRLVAGPLAAMMLGDMGADVVKVEPPTGEDTRFLPPFTGGESAVYTSVNRSKRGIALDFTQPDGLEVLYRLVDRADVVIHNFRPDLRDRLGLSYDTLRARKHDIIVASLSAFGETGPYRTKAGVDLIFQGMGGIMSVTGEPEGRPMRAGPSIADATAGMLLAYGVTLALYAKAAGQGGQHVRLALIDGVLALQTPLAGMHFVTGDNPSRLGNHNQFSEPNGAFRTQDGSDIVVTVFSDKIFRRFVDVIGRPELARDPRFESNPQRIEHRDALSAEIEPVFLTRTAIEWRTLLEEADIPVGPINTYQEVFSDPQVLHNEMVVEREHPAAGHLKMVGIPVKLDGTPGEIRRVAPTLGEHSDEVLAELGLDASRIAALRDRGIVA
jgi:crotonobetainyl-CoA:carnitine CoA-transferase CaiB-like acyl-CoA transferase